MRYFAEAYFNCSMNWSELESIIGDFIVSEDKETIEAFKNEVEILHMYVLEDTMPVRDITGIRTGRRAPDQGEEDVVKIFYSTLQLFKNFIKKKHTICSFCCLV